MKEGCLFVLFCCALGTIGKPLTSRGAPSWFHNVLTCGEKIIEYWTFNSKLKIKNYLIALLVLLEGLQWIGFNEGDLKISKPNLQEIYTF
jgi:hypothetical protein